MFQHADGATQAQHAFDNFATARKFHGRHADVFANHVKMGDDFVHHAAATNTQWLLTVTFQQAWVFVAAAFVEAQRSAVTPQTGTAAAGFDLAIITTV